MFNVKQATGELLLLVTDLKFHDMKITYNTILRELKKKPCYELHKLLPKGNKQGTKNKEKQLLDICKKVEIVFEQEE
jgi:hypothetical protein